jgi:cytochrome c553
MTGLARRYTFAASVGVAALYLVGLSPGLVAPGLVAPSLAQSSARPADAKRGAAIATQGSANVPACAQCHVNAVSDSSGGTFPRIAGQPTDYLAKQMHAFTSPARDNAFMSPIAKALSADEIADVAAHYGSAQGDFSPLPPTDAALVGRGQQLARVGDAERRIQACNNCHGPDGAGLPPTIPYLAGQYAQYIAQELRGWKSGARKTSPDSMAVIAKDLDDQEIAAVAAFYQQARVAAGTAVSK